MLCPANMLGYLSAIRRAAPVAPPSWRRFSQQEPNGKFAGWKPALQEHRASLTSFRAECPGPLPLREAPGHAVEESLFDCDLSSIDQTTMCIETFSPLPLNIFGTWITLLDPSDVPPRNVAESCRRRFLSREGCARARASSRNFRRSAGAPQINGAENLHHDESRRSACSCSIRSAISTRKLRPACSRC